MPDQAPLVRKVTASVAAQGTAGTAQTTDIGVAPFDGVVSKAALLPNAAVTGHASNYRTFTLINKGQAGSGSTAVAAFATNATPANDLVASDEKDLTLSGTAANLVVAADDVLAVVETVAASGVAHGGYQVVVDVTRS